MWNIATKRFPENETNGLMICGINWGGEPAGKESENRTSFFSDSRFHQAPFKTRILKWFEDWGHPLITKSGSESVFEKSILQTNWLNGQAKNMKGKMFTNCVSMVLKIF